MNRTSSLLLHSLTAAAVFTGLNTASAVDFAGQVYPILNRKCSECHSQAKGKTKGKFAIDRKEDLEKQVKAGEPDKSSIVVTVQLPDDDEDVMPPKGKNRLTAQEVALLKQWITEGANFAAQASAPPAAPAPAPAAAPGAPAAGGGVIAWTNNEGKTIEAEFAGLEGTEFVLLKMATGVVHRYPIANLSPESQKVARNGGKP